MDRARVNDSSSEYDSEELDSDKEVDNVALIQTIFILINLHQLQLAFSKGLIKPGLTRVKEPKRASINNVVRLY